MKKLLILLLLFTFSVTVSADAGKRSEEDKDPYVLIAVFVTTGDFGTQNGIAFQEFSSKKSCDAAIRTVKELRIRPEYGDAISMRCVKK